MTNKRHLAFVWALVAIPMFANVQSKEPEEPTGEGIGRLLEASNGYVRLIVDALRWKAPATLVCAQAREILERIAQPMQVELQPRGPLSPELLLQRFQQTEEDTMARHAIFSHRTYDAIALGCLIVPNQTAQKNQ